MKKLLLLTKTLLAAALLCVGQNAWGYVVPTGYEVKNVFFGTDNGDNTVTAEDFATTTATGWSLVGGVYDANRSVSIANITEVAKPEINSAPVGVPTYVAGNCLDVKERDRYAAIKYATYPFSSVSSGYLVFDADIFGEGNYPTYIRFVDSSGNAVLTMHWKDGNTDSSRAFQYQIGTADEVSTSLGGKPRTYHGYGIRDLVVNFATGATSFKLDYINFSGKRVVSDVVELNIGTSKNIAAIQLGYIFNSGGSNETHHSYMDNIKLYTVGVETPSYTYTVKAKAGSKDLGTMATGSCKGGMAFSVAGLPQVIKNGDDYYVLTDAGVSNFSKSYTMEADGSNKDQEIEYTLDNTIVFYGELEALENHGGITEGNFSNGQNAPISGSKYSELGELTRGVYSVTAAVNDRPDRGMIIRSARSTATENSLSYVTTATSGIMNGEFSLYETTTIYLSGITSSGKINQSATMDYIIIRKTADIPENVSVTITSAGWATLYTPYALDFSSVDGLTAYTATCSDNTVTLTPVDNVPANTGVILKGAANTYSIPVVASSSTDQGHLKGSATEATAYDAFDGYTLYVLTTIDEGANVQFNPVNAGSIAAGKAYLKISGGASYARALRVVFDDITGVANVEAAAEVKAKDGKFIENGKLVIVKNGQKFNAAGAKLY